MSGRVFISHASQDSEVAEAVCNALEAHGVPCWIAPRDITPGKEYAHALYDAIVECRALLLVLSANAVASGQVRREIEQAARDGDPIIPFRIDDCEPGPALEFHIGRVEWLAPPSVELAAQIGTLVTIVEAQMAAGAMRPAKTHGRMRIGRGAVTGRLAPAACHLDHRIRGHCHGHRRVRLDRECRGLLVRAAASGGQCRAPGGSTRGAVGAVPAPAADC